MTAISDALSLAHERLAASGSPELDAELLLAEVLGVERGALRARPERLLAAEQLRRFQLLLERRGRGEPVAYLLGRAGFMDFELAVNQSVLIPRPETELLVELALATLAGAPASFEPSAGTSWKQQSGEFLPVGPTTEPGGDRQPVDAPGAAGNVENPTGVVRIADLGAGSGAIAIALARSCPDWRVFAVDISDAALRLARRNAAALDARNIGFLRGSWCEGLADAAFDMIVANPPYVAAGDPALHPDCLCEPDIALFAGADGLDAIREIISQARRCLKPGGWLLLEHGYDQRESVSQLLAASGYRDLRSYRDHAGHDRIVRARRCHPAAARH